MFKKILIANRGEIAVRIARTCREMGIGTVALYEAPDQTSLHIRLADECVLLESPRGFNDQETILQIARAKGADAIHPGYGFLAENADFAESCQAAGITFIGPPASVIAQACSKIETLAMARDAGFNTVESSVPCAPEDSLERLSSAAAQIGYPVSVRSCRGGRGRGARLVQSPQQFGDEFSLAQAEAQAVYGDRHVYVEKVYTAAHQIAVQILGDAYGAYVHLGEREGSILNGNQQVLDESPAPCLDNAHRARLWQSALDLARLFHLSGAVTVEFVVDAQSRFYFTEIKPRIQVEHPLTEVRTRLDLVREQIRLAAGEPLNLTQDEIHLEGWAMACSINAQDPQQNNMPSPGRVRVRFPNGPETRTDTYLYSGCQVPAVYDPLIAKLTVWGKDRFSALARLDRALHELSFSGIATNLPQLQRWVRIPSVQRGLYSTETQMQGMGEPETTSLRDLAIAAALAYVRANDDALPMTSARLAGNWHRQARALPE